MKRIYSNNGIKSLSAPLSSISFSFNLLSESVEVSPGITSIHNNKDLVYYNISGARYYNNYWVVHNGQFDVLYSSTNTSIATINESGFINYIDSGIVNIVVRSPYVAYTTSINMQIYSSDSYTQFYNWEEGSLAYDLHYNIVDRLGDYDSSKINIFNTYNNISLYFVRNTSCWAYDLPIECVSVWNSTNINRKGATLISPKHIVMAHHYQFSIGTEIIFTTKNNDVIKRTIVDKSQISDYVTMPDFEIGLLDEEIPDDTIKFARVLPTNVYEIYLPNLQYNNSFYGNLVVMGNNQYKQALVCGVWFALSSTVGGFKGYKPMNQDIRWWRALTKGDSGNPALWFLSGLPILATTWTGYGGEGPSYIAKRDIYNEWMLSHGGYTFTEIDISNYPTYE